MSDPIIVDNFAGGGGASLGIEMALGRSPDIAVNHDAEAIAMHAANHPHALHLCESVWTVDPVAVCAGRPVELAWFSPDCKHFSRAKGGRPVEKRIRGLAWVAIRWAAAVRPRVIILENVPEFVTWGPLVDDRPCPIKRGLTFRRFVGRLRALGYDVEWRTLSAADYGAPTTRKRLFLVARCDGQPIRWPTPTHGPLAARPWRAAAECIDWSLPCPSIFDRDRPLAEATLRRIARGIRQFVMGPRPFIVPLTHHGERAAHDVAAPLPTITGANRGELAVVTPFVSAYYGGERAAEDGRAHGADAPLPTVTTENRFALVAPYLIHQSNGERPGQAPRTYDPRKPINTVVAGGIKQAVVAAWLAKHYGGNESSTGGTGLDRPVDTITAVDHHSLAAVHLSKLYGTSTGSSVNDPAPTVTGGGTHLAQVCAFLARYNGTGDAEPVDRPLGTVTARDRFALATVTLNGESYRIVDIGMRMLTPRELARAQGFPDDYVFAPGSTKTAQVRLIGNSVAPPIAAAIVRANLGHRAEQERAA